MTVERHHGQGPVLRPGRGPSPNGPVLLARRTQARVGDRDRDRDQDSVGICPQTPSHFLTAGPTEAHSSVAAARLSSANPSRPPPAHGSVLERQLTGAALREGPSVSAGHPSRQLLRAMRKPR